MLRKKLTKRKRTKRKEKKKKEQITNVRELKK
jgi:hypothetical protein